MARGDFTKEEADRVIGLVGEMWKALGKHYGEFSSHANDIFLFLEKAKRRISVEKKRRINE